MFGVQLVMASWLLLGLAVACAGQLLAVVELSRHGARSPSHLYPFDQDYWDPDFPEELTGVGMRQHYLIGAELRQRLVVDSGLIGSEFNASHVEVWSTDVNRTLMSAYSQLVGLFPAGLGPTLPPNQVYRPPFAVHDEASIENKLGNAALPLQWQSFPVQSQPELEDYVLMGYSGSTCPKMDTYVASVLNSDDYQSKQNQLNMTLFRALAGALGVPIRSIKEAAAISSALECDVAAGLGLPPKLPLSLYAQLQQVHGYYRYTVPFADTEARKLAFSGFFEMILSEFGLALEGKGKAFRLYVGHDTMLSGLLAVFNEPQDINPPFASVMLFTLYENQTVSVTYNDREIGSVCDSPPCPYPSFFQFLTEHKDPNYVSWCHNLA